MNHRQAPVRAVALASCFAMATFALLAAPALAQNSREVVLNPYQEVDWDSHEHHIAGLHVHTLQSDGQQMVQEVVETYRDAGFTILALTDHDNFAPNRAVPPDQQEQGEGTPYPDPRPDNFPHNTTWPWADYGGPAPEELDMLGIEAAELTFQHHMNSFFSSYNATGDHLSEDEQLEAVAEKGGVVFLDHPGISADWWERRPVDWYVERFENHPADVLIGLEVTNSPTNREAYDERLWDQLLARLMPERPVWGFGTDDMHNLASARESDTVFLLDQLTEQAAQQAMKQGRFYFRKSSREVAIEDGRGPFPELHRLKVDQQAGTIELEASGYDTVVWISAPESLEPINDYQTSHEPWPAGRVIQTDDTTLNYRENDQIDRYVRVELHYEEDGETYRLFTNPIGFE